MAQFSSAGLFSTSFDAYKDKLLGEKESIKLSSNDEAEKVVNFQADHSVLMDLEKKRVMFAGAPYHPIEMITRDEMKNAVVMERGDMLNRFGGIDPDEPENWACAKHGTGLFMVISVGCGKYLVIPVHYTAYQGILQQAGDDGAIMQTRGEYIVHLPDGTMYKEYKTKGMRSALPIQTKAARLTEDFYHCLNSCQVLLREGGVEGLFSSQYRYIPAKHLKLCLESRLKEDFPDYEFAEGEVSHEYLWLRYRLNTPEFEGTIKGLLNDAGYAAQNVSAGVRLSTSDVGRGSILTMFYVNVDRVEMPLGGVSMPHLGNASAEKYSESIKNAGALLKDCDAPIERLADMDVRHPGKVLQEIYRHDRKGSLSGLGAIINSLAADLTDKLRGGGNGIDVYMAFNNALRIYRENNKPSPTKYLELSEYIAERVLFLPFDMIDKGLFYK